jgi:catechol 2,3-dioxygenase-like lactoylglutathione lyase family enzyme
MKTHLSLPTAHFEKSIAFYATLFKTNPFKRRDDYALFVVDDPGLELALVPSNRVSVDAGAHFGLAADHTDIVDEAAARLAAAGLRIDVERDETCCYAKQNKVWATDPDGRRWEVYYVIEESDKGTSSTAGCCTPATSDSYESCCACTP